MEAMLKNEEAKEEGRVKKNMKKKMFQFGAPPGPWGLTGAQEQNCASALYNWRPGGRPWAPPGPRSAEKIKLANLGFLHPI